MKRKKHVESLFEPRARWSELPLNTQQKVVDQLAQLCVQFQSSHSPETTLTSPDAGPEIKSTQETKHDP